MNANRYRPALENLETRDTPAGTVTGSFHNGTWTLVGDVEDNNILVNQTNLDEFSVTGLNGTLTAGVTNPGKVRNIVIKLGDGNDSVTVNNTGVSAFLLGNLKVFGGHGVNAVTIDRLQIDKNLSITNGINVVGYDLLTLSDSIIHGNVVVKNGVGSSVTNIASYSATHDSAIGGNLVIRNEAGADYTTVVDTSIGGNVLVRNGLPDADDLAGGVAIFNEYETTARSVIGGNVSVSYLAGEIDGYDGIWDTEVLGNVKFNYGSANADLYFDGYSVLQPVRIHGNLTVIGQGTIYVDVGQQYQKTGLIVDKNLTIHLGRGSDTIELTSLHVGGAASILTGAGFDHLKIDDATFAGPTRIETGADVDELMIETRPGTSFGTQFAGVLKVNLGAGDDTLGFGVVGEATRKVELLAQAYLNGGDGGDTVLLFNLFPVFGAPAMKSIEVIM